MEKPWLKSYPADVPEHVDTNRYTSIAELIDVFTEQYADSVAAESFGCQITYRELYQQSEALAAYLQQELKLAYPDRLAIMLPNTLQYPLSLFAAFRAGLVVMNVNPLYKAPEILHQLQDSGAKAIIVMENFVYELEKILPETDIEHVIVTSIGEFLGFKGRIIDFVIKYVKRLVPKYQLSTSLRLKQLMNDGKDLKFVKPVTTADQMAFLQYTGGTTGVAKGAVLTHRNILANIEQVSAWIMSALTPGKDIVVMPLPIYHIFALTSTLVCMSVGGNILLIANPRDIPSFVKTLKSVKMTVFVTINTLCNALLDNSEFAKLDFSALKLVVAGGMALQRAVAERWQRVTGKVVIEGYGLTESSPVTCVNRMDSDGFTGSIGLPISDTEAVVKDAFGNVLPVGEVGELCVRGPQVMQGYWQKPEETREVIDPQGWLHTGDLATIDKAGYVYFVERQKDMINVSGFNVYPNEVEEVLVSHPDIKLAAVIGVRDDKSTEAVKAFIISANPALSAEEVVEYCHTKLTNYKVPKYIEFRKELPLTNVGKVLRRKLRH